MADRLRIALASAPAVEADLPWADGTAVAGVLALSASEVPDGEPTDPAERANRLVAAGADVVDLRVDGAGPAAVGGGPTGEAGIEPETLAAVVEELAPGGATVAVRTGRPALARAALAAGADVIEDATGFADPALRRAIADAEAGAILTHAIERPGRTRRPRRADLVADAVAGLTERLLLADRAGIERDRILVDPGIGVGEDTAPDLARIDELTGLGRPVGVDLTRAVTATDDDGSTTAPAHGHATAAVAGLAAAAGASLIRVAGPEHVAAAVAGVERAAAVGPSLVVDEGDADEGL